MQRRTTKRAFTLLELVLVMVLIAVGLAVAAPSLQGWNRGTKLRNQADQLVSVTRWARTHAIADSTVYRLNIDPSGSAYSLTKQSGQEFVAVESSEWGRSFQLEDATLQLTDASGAVTTTVDFHPDGRTDQATLQLKSSRGDTLQIKCDSPAEGFVLAANSGGAS